MSASLEVLPPAATGATLDYAPRCALRKAICLFRPPLDGCSNRMRHKFRYWTAVYVKRLKEMELDKQQQLQTGDARMSRKRLSEIFANDLGTVIQAQKVDISLYIC